MLTHNPPVSCSLRGCLQRTERGADGRPVDRKWLTLTSPDGCQVRHFCTEAHYQAWRAQQAPAVAVPEPVKGPGGWRKGTKHVTPARAQFDPVDPLDDAEPGDW
jgi:hypothetical protein